MHYDIVNTERKFPVHAVFNLTVVTDGDDNEARMVQRCLCSICNAIAPRDYGNYGNYGSDDGKYFRIPSSNITVGGDSSAGVDFVLDYIKTHKLNVRLALFLTNSHIHSLIHQVKLHIISLGKFLEPAELQRYKRASSETNGTTFMVNCPDAANINGLLTHLLTT